MTYYERNRFIYMFIVFVLLMCSIYAWRLTFIRYDIGNFDVVLTSENPLLVIALMMISSIILMLIILQSKGLSPYSILFSFIGYLYVVYMGPFIANPTFFIHRDVFLHLPYSLYIAKYGRIPLFSDRLDVVSYPNSFILYSIYSCLTNISDPRLLGSVMAVLYPTLLAVSILILARSFSFQNTTSIPYYEYVILTIIVLPFISRFAPAPGFPHRYHLAFVQTSLLLHIFIQLIEHKSFMLQKVICVVLLSQSIIFTHPYYSFLLTIMMIVYPLLGLLKKDKDPVRKKSALLYVTVPMLFIVHSLYLAYSGILQEAYRIVFSLPDRLMDFVEISLPVRVKSVEWLITITSTVIRNIWRVYIAITTFGTALMYLYVLRRGIKHYALSLTIASIVLTPLLIGSTLWWERSLTFIAMALLCALGEILYIDKKGSEVLLRSFKKYFLPALFVISVIISPLIRWERPLLADNWQGYEKEAFMATLALRTEVSEIYMGVYSAIDLTYCRVHLYPQHVPNSKTIFEPAMGILTRDVSSITGVYAMSVRDPEYELVDLKQLLPLKNLVWSSGTSYIFS